MEIKPIHEDYDRFNLTEHDFEKARLRFVIDHLMEDIVDVYFDADNNECKENVRLNILKYFHPIVHEGDEVEAKDDCYGETLFKKRWDEYFFQSLSCPHCGDCTKVACACSRCWAEGYLKVDTAPKWRDGKMYRFDDKMLTDLSDE